MRKLLGHRRAITPVISTVILTGVIVTLVGVGLAYSNTLVQSNMSSNDYSQGQKFMQTTALTMDDVAWTVGKTGTVLYNSRYGYVQFASQVLNYTIYVKQQGSSQYTRFASYYVGIMSFNVPSTYYSLGNGYYSQIFPSTVSTLTLTGSSAPVARVFSIEKIGTITQALGSFLRVATVPTIRYLNSTFSGSGSNPYYMRLYLTVLTLGASPHNNQDITLTGTSLTIPTINNVQSINVTVSFPQTNQGYDNSFFHFPSTSQIITPPAGYSDQVLEVYVGTISVQLGV